MSSESSILLIDDNPAVADAVGIAVRVAGYQLDLATRPEEALLRLAESRYRTILLDLNFSPGVSDGAEGLRLLRKIMEDDPDARVIVLTAYGGVRTAVDAMQLGARDFVIKPWRNEDLISRIEALSVDVVEQRPPGGRILSERPSTGAIIGESPAIENVRALIRRVGPTLANVAISGPPGSGKTLAALSIHALSTAGDQEPLQIDLRDGIDGDTLGENRSFAILKFPDLLDTVTQDQLARLLRQEMRCVSIVEDVAGLTPGLQRSLATAHVRIPALENRDNDAVLLARHFARRAAEKFGRDNIALSSAAEEVINQTVWPDGVRGLALAIERAVLLAEGEIIDSAALPAPNDRLTEREDSDSGGYHLHTAEKSIIAAALRDHNNNVTKAADALGISRGALYRRMERYGL